MKRLVLKNNDKMTISESTKYDAEKLINYIKEISAQSDFLTFGRGEFDVSIEEEEKMLENILSSNNNLNIIALIDNKIVGNLTFRGGHRPRIRHTGEFGVSVLKDYWGLGIGKELVKYLINWAEDGDIVKKINLRVREDNKKAIRLYKSLGFKKEGMITRDLYLNGKYYSSIQMGLELD